MFNQHTYSGWARRPAALLAIILVLVLTALLPQPTLADGPHGEGQATPAQANPPAPQPAIDGTSARPAAQAASEAVTEGWQDGAMQSTMDYNCYTGMLETTTNEFVGYWGTSDVSSPRVGDVYYGRVVAGGVGHPCGGPYAHIEILLPPSTSLAIDQNNPVRCATANSVDFIWHELPTTECEQQPWQGTYGLVFNRDNGEPWPVQDTLVMVMFPMISTKPLSGIATNSYLQGAIKAVDGENNPWDDPKQGVFVAANAPAVSYPSPSTTNITAQSATSRGTVFNHYTAGNVYFDLGTTTAYGISTAPVALPADYDGYNLSVNWSNLQPGTTYHWRLRYVSGGQTYNGADQTFTTSSVSTNRLANPGFELDGNNDGKPDKWSSNAKFTRSSTARHGGSYAGRFAATDNTGATVSQAVQNVSAGASYAVSGWVNIPPTTDAFTFKIQVRWRRADNTTISTSTVKSYTAATAGWVQATATKVAPAETTNAQVLLVASNLNATIYVDDLTFR
jgi:hypothetical protein